MTELLVATSSHLLAYDLDTEELELLSADGSELAAISWGGAGSELVTTHRHEFGDAGLRVGFRVGPTSRSEPAAVQCIGSSIVVADHGRACVSVLESRTLTGPDHRYTVDGVDVRPTALATGHGRLWVLGDLDGRGTVLLNIDWPSMRLVESTASSSSAMHDLWVHTPDDVLVCDSLGSRLVDFRTGAAVFTDLSGGHLRGLAATDDLIFVGRGEGVTRTERERGSSGVWVLARKGWKMERFIDLGRLGEVRQVRVIDEPDRVHGSSPLRRGAAFSGARAHRVDAARRLAKSQLAIERRPRLDGTEWSSDVGVVAAGDDGSWRNGTSAVSISTRREEARVDGEVRLRLVIEDPATVGSVAAVARYLGPGDTRMIIGLARTENQQLILGLYESRPIDEADEAVWIERGHHLYALGMGESTFEVGLRVAGPVASVLLDGVPVIDGQLMDTTHAGRFGVRFVGEGIAVRELVTTSGQPTRSFE